MTAKDILRDLIAINTIKDKENKEIMDYIENFVKPLGFDVDRRMNPDTGKEVLVATFGDNPTLGFLGHTDTVDITARVNPRTTARPGDTIQIALDLSKIHIFDKETEQIITH